jgi:hypothetical protein
LLGLKLKWSNDPDFKWPRLMGELDRTIRFLERKVTDPSEKD